LFLMRTCGSWLTFARGGCFAAFLSLTLAFAGISSAQTTGAVSSPGLPEAGMLNRMRAREAWFVRGRSVAGTSAAGLRQRAVDQKMRMRHEQAARRPQTESANYLVGTSWSALGPTALSSDASGNGLQDYNYVSGRATAIAVDPNDLGGNTVYVGGAYGGVWKSTKAGPLTPDPSQVQWTPVTESQATLSVGAIAIQPQASPNPDASKSVVLVGTGEANSATNSYYGLGILRSTDAGTHWTLISSANSGGRSFAGLSFSRIAFNSNSPNVVVAAASASAMGIGEGLENPATANRGLYSSSDGGVNWTYATVQDSATTIAPDSAIAVAYNAAAGKFFAAVRYHGFYSSTDGTNWVRIPGQPGAGLPATACPAATAATCPIYRAEIAVVPGRNEMYAWYVDANSVDQGIYRSLDGGNAWSQINESGLTECGDSYGCGTEQGTYNLALAAVPDGATTDLIAGAENLFKCRALTSDSNICTGGSWMNLTHAYGCSSIARVHPDQHAIAFPASMPGGKELLYFANDGGVYRALDGFTRLMTGTCGDSNQSDSLNQTLGSLAQFVSLAVHPADPDTVLGGSVDIGSPASASALTSKTWLSVMSGDVGTTNIDPVSNSHWYLASPDSGGGQLSVKECPLGVACHTLDFSDVVTSADVGGDDGALYFPFVLDPQSNSALILGTCRVWRGPRTGGSFTQLSNNFDTGAGPCAGTEVNLVRAVAAGGPSDGNGSKVIYATTDGPGPLQGQSAVPGGRVWVTTNASAGPPSWSDVTSDINPDQYVVSSVAIDTADATGQTAYVSIMGFGVSHVWKTSSAGSTWTDFTANLPDAPANALVVDASVSPSVVYVGTDVGVFSSSSVSANWSEVGPATGIVGFLPNVAVTALKILTKTATKKLYAATYGRGLWEFDLIVTPDFSAVVSNPTLVVADGKAPQFDASLFAFGGYASAVNLSCTKQTTSPPAGCAASPTTVTPSTSGSNFVVNANALSVADYTFNIHAVGTDDLVLTHDTPITLHVVDFNVSAPAPSSTTAIIPSPAAPVMLNVSVSGTVALDVTLACSGLPAGAACSFLPQGDTVPTTSLSVTADAPVPVQLTITTGSNSPTGSYSVTISASSLGVTKTQTLAVIVTDSGFSFKLDSSSLSILAGQTGTLTGSITTTNGYSSPINLSCMAGNTVVPPTCKIDPAKLTPSSGKNTITVTLGATSSTAYACDITAAGTDSATITSTQSASLNVFDFQFPASLGSHTVTAGQSASYAISFTVLGGTKFPDVISLTCGGLPSQTTCSFSPASIAAGSAATTITLTVATTAPSAKKRAVSATALGLQLICWPGLLGLILRGGKRGKYPKLCGIVLLLMIPLILTSCGGGGATVTSSTGTGTNPPLNGTKPGNYDVVVTATSGPLSHSGTGTLVVQ
jgi:hypothetical protein